MEFRVLSRRRRQQLGGRPGSGFTPGTNADLSLLYDQIRQLRELAGDPGQAGDADRVYDFSIRWGTFLNGRLARLVEYDRRGVLTPAQRKQFTALCAELRDVAPLAEKLGLAAPRLHGERRR